MLMRDEPLPLSSTATETADGQARNLFFHISSCMLKLLLISLIELIHEWTYMPHHNLSPEIVVAGAIWLTAILIFFLMLIATFASLRSDTRTEPKPVAKTEEQFSSVAERFARFFPKRKNKKIEDSLDIS
jgi:hypothetical protein